VEEHFLLVEFISSKVIFKCPHFVCDLVGQFTDCRLAKLCSVVIEGPQRKQKTFGGREKITKIGQDDRTKGVASIQQEGVKHTSRQIQVAYRCMAVNCFRIWLNSGVFASTRK
jgi:hypothetical protein